MSRKGRLLDVAIVGMACRFAGAGDLFAYWQNVLDGRESIREIPPTRWDANTFYDPDSNASDRVGGHRGGYLDEPVMLDAAALGVMPRTLEGGEPEQFLVLDAARSALHDAGLGDGVNDGRRVDVIIGRGNYFNRGNLTRLQHGRVLSQSIAILRALHPEWSDSDLTEIRDELRACLPPFEAATIPGQLTNATAGRISHHFGLTGPNLVVDAASASALVALDLGAQSLASSRSDLAIVGGVYIAADVDFPMVFSRLGVLSRSGKPRPFRANADGMVPGEGVGVVILKRVRDAERDGDRIYAVLKGIGQASDGKGRGLAAPDAKGHLSAIRRAYRNAGIDPATVGLIEGHGLGVPAADRAELKALRAAFPPIEPGGDRVLGAASALVGHAMPAAGMAGLIKAALALHHRVLPASPGDDDPLPLLRRSHDRMRLNPSSRPWIDSGSGPRRAGVNAFGFAGINAHAVLESHPSSDGNRVPGALLHWPDEAILIAANDRHDLIGRVASLADRLRKRPGIFLKDLAASLNPSAASSKLPTRLGLVAGSISELIDRLHAVGQRLTDPKRTSLRDGAGAYFWDRPAGLEGGLAFLFPGEGSQYPGMLADLCIHFPEVRLPFDQIDRMAKASGAIKPPTSLLFGGGKAENPALWETSTAVHVVLAAQWALYRLLRRLGLRPDAVCGHSSGEFPALVAAGAIPEDDRLEERFNALASVFSDLERSGAIPEARMIGVAAARDRVEGMLGDTAGEVTIAVDNCPHQVVLAGPAGPVDSVADRLRCAGIGCEVLPFTKAYHSPAFAPALGPITVFFEAMVSGSPSIPVYSCCLADRFPNDPSDVRHLASAQWTRPVEFRKTVEAMHADGFRVFVDVGGRGNLAAFVEDTLRNRAAFAVAANLPKRSGPSQLNHLIASLFAQGVSIDPSALYARRRPEPIDLEAELAPPAALVPLRLGFPEMSLPEEFLTRFSPRVGRTGDHSGLEPGPGPVPDCVGKFAESSLMSMNLLEDDAVMASFFETMQSFLETQRHMLACVLESKSSSGHALDQEELGPLPSLMEAGVGGLHVDACAIDTPNHCPSAPASGTIRRRIDRIILDAIGDPVADHHTFGGRRISAIDPERKGLPVLPFTVMAEMLTRTAAALEPGNVLVGLRDVRARRWIRYEDEPITLEIKAESDPDHPGSIRVALFNRGPIDGTPRAEERPEVEAVAVFAPRRVISSELMPFDLGPSAGPTRFTAESIYAEQWLFHGPALRAVVGIGEASNRGIEGTLRVLPRRALNRDPSAPPPLTDPIVLDAFTHLLGCWGLDQLPEGDVIFPLRLGSLEIFGDDPPEGTDVSCRIAVKEIDRLRIAVDAEIVRTNGHVWMRLTDWEDWRFYWPPRYRDVFRQPHRELLGEPICLPGIPPDAVAVWLQPPADMGRPIWRDVLEQVQLSPIERSGCLRPTGPEQRRTLRLWGRIAAKEAARRLWLLDGGSSVYPADLSIEPDSHGRPILRSHVAPSEMTMPAVSIAHTGGVAVALACRHPGAAIGIDVERVIPRSSSFEELAFTREERALLNRVGGDDRAAWIARFWCAKEAVGKATGRGMVAGPSSVQVVEADQVGGQISTRLGPELAAARPDLVERPLVVGSTLRDDFALAWIVMEAQGR